jgi:hypothetical protein
MLWNWHVEKGIKTKGIEIMMYGLGAYCDICVGLIKIHRKPFLSQKCLKSLLNSIVGDECEPVSSKRVRTVEFLSPNGAQSSIVCRILLVLTSSRTY